MKYVQSAARANYSMDHKMYEKRAVLFMDLLGFSELVSSGRGPSLLAVLQDLQSQARAVERVGKMNFTVFSDCIVVSAPLSHSQGVLNVVEYARILALDLLAKGFLTRGAIVHGDLFHEDGIVLGPALINAYYLESKKALYPRILVDHQILKMASENLERDRPTVAGVAGRYFREDFDGSYHLDIFHNLYFVPQLYWGEKMDIGTTQFRDACLDIVSRMFDEPPPPIAEEKYGWFANYFFDKCQQYQWPLPDKLPISSVRRERHSRDLADAGALDAQE